MHALSVVWLLSLALMLVPAKPSAAQARPLTPFASQKAERLLREKLACLGCHRLARDGGMLAPSLDDVQTRRSPAYIAAIIAEPQRVVPGAAMPRARMPAKDLALVTRYLGGDPTTVDTSPSPATPAVADTSIRALYAKWCSGCHGTAGKGDGPNAPHLPVPPASHANATTISLRSDDALYDTISGGGSIMNRSARMPAFGASLSPAEIRGLVRYIRTLCQCEGPAWSRAERGT